MITASLVLYNNKEEDVRKVVGCVHKSIIDTLFVIDNSPTDKLRSLISKLTDKSLYIYGQGNVGYGKAHNIGIRHAIEKGAVFHIVLNPDIFFEDKVILTLSNFAEKHNEVGLILPKVVYPNGDLQYLCKLLPTPLDIFGRRILPERMMEKRNGRYEMHQFGYDKIWNCPILSGCFMFLRVSDLIKTGGFDERFFMYFEDFDLMRRLHKISKTVFYPHVSIIHDHASEHHTNKKLLKASIKSAVQYFSKWGWIIDTERRKVNRHAFDISNLVKD